MTEVPNRPPLIAALLQHRDAWQRLSRTRRKLVRWGYSVDLLEASGWEQLADNFAPPQDVVGVVDPYWGGRFAIERLHGLLRQARPSEVILYADFRGPGVASDVAQLVSLGLHRVRSLGYDDSPSELADEVLSAFGQAAIRDTWRHVAANLTPEQELVLGQAIRRGWRATTVEDLAEDLGVSTRSLRRWVEDWDGFTPSTAVQWARVLHASQLISRADLSTSALARRLQFSSYSDFCRRYQRVVGVPVGELPRDQLFETAMRAFLRAIERATG